MRSRGAGSGYYWAAMKSHRKATALVLANLLSMAVSTYFVVQYLQYYEMAVNGQHVRDLVFFSTFLDLAIRNQKLGLFMATGLDTGALARCLWLCPGAGPNRRIRLWRLLSILQIASAGLLR